MQCSGVQCSGPCAMLPGPGSDLHKLGFVQAKIFVQGNTDMRSAHSHKQCVLCSARCTLYTIQSTLQCAVYSVQYRVDSAHYTVKCRVAGRCSALGTVMPEERHGRCSTLSNYRLHCSGVSSALCSSVLCNVQSSVLQCSVVQCTKVLCSLVHRSEVQCTVAQYSTVM